MKKCSIKKVQLSALLFLVAGIIAVLFLSNVLGATPITAQAAASSSEPYSLSQMTNEECSEFIIESGMEIPYEFQGSSELGGVVKDIIGILEKNPNHEFHYCNPEMLRFAKDIKSIVAAYYNSVPSTQTPMALAATTLHDSVVEGHGTTAMENITAMPMQSIRQIDSINLAKIRE